MLRRGRDLNEWQLGAINTIQQSGEHLLRLISDILDLSKIEAGKLELSLSVVPLPDLLSGVANAVRLKAEEKSLSFLFSVPDDLPQWVQADEKRLRQVLLNLLGNAVKFTDSGQVTLRVGLLSGTQTQIGLRVEVEDTGIGIPHDKLQTIFEPFEQVSDIQRQSAGTGLGLSITRDLIRLMGSEVNVESAVGSGSRFWFNLDLPLSEAGQAETLNSLADCGYVGPRRSVLIVDDIPANRALLSDALSSVGFTVREATNGEEGLDQAASDPPDLILMDVMMPVMDGLEATRRIRALAQPRQPSIIAISASVTTDDRARVLAAGADAFIGKPIDLPQLFREIGNLLALQWIKDEQEPSDPQAGAAFVAPPQDEIRFLRELARAGNMRRIKARARELAALDGTFEPFANRLLQLADDFDSEAILDLVSEHSDQQRGAA